ncbi:MAG: thiamine pyrophosphate-binding protein [Candidatus Micrarchaeia archaeon]
MGNKMRVADYISGFIAGKGVDRVFMVVGGLSMHLVDAFARQEGMKYVSMHHEQACVMAAEAYARQTGKFGVACVTGGPGAVNTLTGVVSAHFDSSPVLVISGQTKVGVIEAEGVRQFGVQGFNTLPIFKNVSKYAVLIKDASMARYEMEKALHICKSGHPGVVWVEVPLDVQGMEIDPDALKGYVPEDESAHYEREAKEKVPKLVELLKNSSRPLFLFGNGVRLSQAKKQAIGLAEKLRVPVITSRLGIDLIGSDNPIFIGRPGTYGDRPANFAAQTCDLLVVVGCRLSMSLTGYGYAEFAANAKRVMVDVDSYEMNKPSVASFDLKINSDASVFLRRLADETGKAGWQPREKWLEKCTGWKQRYPVVLPEYSRDDNGINSYYFTERLSMQLSQDDTIVVDTSSPFHVVSQAIKIKDGQRYITTGGLSTMGYALPAAIGTACAKTKGRTVVVVGDGSFQMNIQELQTIVHYRVPAKIFLWNNSGYLLIRHTQNNFQGGRLAGESPKTGMSCPDTEKIAAAYGIKFLRASKVSELDGAIKQALETEGPVICEVKTPELQLVIPRVSSEKGADGKMISHPFDDMYPNLGRETYAREKKMDY